jgi:hypothetical protein
LAQGGERFAGGTGALGEIENAVAGLALSRLARLGLVGAPGIGATWRCSS